MFVYLLPRKKIRSEHTGKNAGSVRGATAGQARQVEELNARAFASQRGSPHSPLTGQKEWAGEWAALKLRARDRLAARRGCCYCYLLAAGCWNCEPGARQEPGGKKEAAIAYS